MSKPSITPITGAPPFDTHPSSPLEGLSPIVDRPSLSQASSFGPFHTLDSPGDDNPTHWKPSKKLDKRKNWKGNEELQITEKCVVNAVSIVLGVTAQVIYDFLKYGSEFLHFVPIVGLPEAAKILLRIWQSLRRVNENHRARLRLMRRCAFILQSVHSTIGEAGAGVGTHLQDPIANLVASYAEVERYLIQLAGMRFLMRYVQREEIRNTLEEYHTKLTDALRLFSVAIQVQTLRQALQSEKHHYRDVPLADLTASNTTSTHAAPLTAAGHFPGDSNPVSDEEVERVRVELKTMAVEQNRRDAELDEQDLQQQIEEVLHEHNDFKILKVLQIKPKEIPEAIETFQSVLETHKPSPYDSQSTLVVASPPETPHLEHTVTGSVEPGHSNAGRQGKRDSAYDSKFIATSIEAMQRLSRGDITQPDWAIAEYEVELETQIGIGSFSTVYKGTWRKRTVAIKYLRWETTPRDQFKKEMSIWKTLDHPNVLTLLGASSARQNPPWFFVSPYLANGSLVSYLKSLDSLDSVHTLQIIAQIAKGMAYLHKCGILHGDLKAANILVDDDLKCVISDFGQSEMKFEAYRLSGINIPSARGTLRWQAPEILLGQSQLTPQIDVYAFAITCTEVLNKGGLPWGIQNDKAVRDLVLNKNTRPTIPDMWRRTPEFYDLLRLCWHLTPRNRLRFPDIERRLQTLQEDLPADLIIDEREGKTVPIIDLNTKLDEALGTQSMQDADLPITPRHEKAEQSTVTDSAWTLRDPSCRLSLLSTAYGELAQARRYERQYRTQLQHQFHRSLTLPLWSPSPINIGAVGYYDESSGSFVTLLNSLEPSASTAGHALGIPSVKDYGDYVLVQQEQGARGVMQRMADVFWRSFLSSWSSPGGAAYLRRYTSPLRAGRDAAYMFTGPTVYRYMDSLSAPKEWFKTHVEQIVRVYGEEHHITKQDIYLVIGTLSAQDYALFVSRKHSDCQVNFDVFPTAWTGQPWGHFSFGHAPSVVGPTYDGAVIEDPQYGDNISKSGSSDAAHWSTLLLSRLRFEEGEADPTHQ